MTSPAIQMLNISIVLYSELFFTIMGHLKTVGGDQTPTAGRNDGVGTTLRISR